MPGAILWFKTHGSEWQGQERAKRIANNKTRDELLCVFSQANIFVIWHHNHSQYLSTRVNF